MAAVPTTGILALDIIAYTGVIASALTGTLMAVRGLWRFNRRLVHVVDAVAELKPNGGTSLKDQVTRIEQRVDELTRRFDQHLAVDHNANNHVKR